MLWLLRRDQYTGKIMYYLHKGACLCCSDNWSCMSWKWSAHRGMCCSQVSTTWTLVWTIHDFFFFFCCFIASNYCTEKNFVNNSISNFVKVIFLCMICMATSLLMWLYGIKQLYYSRKYPTSLSEGHFRFWSPNPL